MIVTLTWARAVLQNGTVAVPYEEAQDMIRLTKEADYAIVLLIRIAEDPEPVAHSARGLAAEVLLPVPIVSKVLKALARQGLLQSQRGARGGYRLAVAPQAISVADIVTAIEGPIAVTECQMDAGSNCCIEPMCSARQKWNRINQVIHQTLDDISLAEMASPLGGAPSAAVEAATPAEKSIAGRRVEP